MYLYEYLNSKNQNTLIQESGLKGVCLCVCVKKSLITKASYLTVLRSQSLYFVMYNIDRMPEFEFEAASTTARCATNELGAFESIGSGSRLQL